ncbi:hypothetical protein [Acinetobacter proteolyticus]|uniref:hypothetical protein n=1 Tax=Acinetobacter proteolyticus TaxID=1776741 RepID=UPI003D995C41
MRSEFENHFRKTLFYSNMLFSAAKSGIAIEPFEKVRGQYRNAYVQLAYSIYAHQQAKVDAAIRVLNEAKTGNYGFNHEGADIESFIFDLEQALKGEG